MVIALGCSPNYPGSIPGPRLESKMILWLEKNHKIALLISILIAVFIFYISSLTFSPSQGGSAIPFKSVLYHIGVFFLFSFFLAVSLTKGKYKSLIIPSVLISIIYGISDELHQVLVPGRHASLGDVFLNTLGIITASSLYLAFIAFRERERLMQ